MVDFVWYYCVENVRTEQDDIDEILDSVDSDVFGGWWKFNSAGGEANKSNVPPLGVYVERFSVFMRSLSENSEISLRSLLIKNAMRMN